MTATTASTATDSTWDSVSGSGVPLNINDASTTGSSTTNTSYIYGDLLFGGTAPIEQITTTSSGTSVSYLVSNQTGVQGVYNGSGSSLGAVQEMDIYSVYGIQTISSGSKVTPFGFQGSYTDPTGLIYLINRYYDPATDQFLSIDPDVAETNQPYVFTNDDPLNATDPLGLYKYKYDWVIGTTKKVGSASSVLKYLENNAGSVFPFSTGGCNKLTLGEHCNFSPFGTKDSLTVTSETATSITLTVNNWCQVGAAGVCAAGDPPGSTITFSTGTFKSGGHTYVYLQQDANSPGASPITDAAVDDYHAAAFAWHAQASNLAHALGGGNTALIEGPGWSSS
jgi:RHS repeat-associated protein